MRKGISNGLLSGIVRADRNPPIKGVSFPYFLPPFGQEIWCPSGMRTKVARLQEPNHSGVGEGFHPLPPVIHPETIAFRLRMVPLYGRAQRPAPTPSPQMTPLLKRLGGERFRSRKRIFRQTSFRLTMLVGRNFKKRYVIFRIVSHGAKRYFDWVAFRNREGGSQPPYKRRFFSIFLAAVWARNMVPVRHEDKGGHLMGVI